MRLVKSLSLLFLALFILFALGCSKADSPTEPLTNFGQGGGEIFEPGDPELLDPIPFPWWDCQRFFLYHGSVSFYSDPDGPHTIPLIVDGSIRIRDKDCSAPISRVRVNWKGNYYDEFSPNIPGFKFQCNDHKYYIGRMKTSETLLGGGWIVWERYYLVTHPASNGLAGDVIEGWYHRLRDDWMLVSGGEIIHDYHHAHLTISHGHEMFLEAPDPIPKP